MDDELARLMVDTQEDEASEALRDDAYAWVVRIRSGEATAADTAEMLRWRARSPEHAIALGRAIKTHQRLLLMGRLHDTHARRAPFEAAVKPGLRQGRTLTTRRAVLGGALAASAAGAAVMAARPPLDLWPSLTELSSDYRTRVGERRTVDLAKGVSVELNTRSAIALRSDDQMDGFELVSGEVAVDAVQPRRTVVVRANASSVISNGGRFGVRRDGARTCVTCLAGKVAIMGGAADRTELTTGQQLWFAKAGASKIATVDLARAEAWRRGVLVFGGEPMAQVVTEINRYRPGRIILANKALSDIPVNAVFQIDRMDRAVPLLREAAGAQATHLPGDVVVLS